MIGIFKQKSSVNALVLFVYALVLKFPVFLHPYLPVIHKEDNYLYRYIITGLDSLFNHSALAYTILAFLIVYAQALLFNSICNYHKMLPKATWLPAMAYILVTGLLTEWSHFSAPLLIDLLLIWCWYRMVGLYNSQNPSGTIFNIGLFLGLATLLYIPAIAFLLLLFFALVIMRPFRVQEWFVGFIGFTTPYYFLILLLYFTHQLQFRNLIPDITFIMPATPTSIWTTVGIALLVIPFISGSVTVQQNLNKMLIHVRKSWSLLLAFLVVAVLVIIINRALSYENWVVTAMPFAAFHAAAYYYPVKKIFPLVLHWLCVALILAVNYVF